MGSRGGDGPEVTVRWERRLWRWTWSTVPGMLTALGTFLTGAAAIVLALRTGGSAPEAPTAPTTSTASTAPAPLAFPPPSGATARGSGRVTVEEPPRAHVPQCWEFRGEARIHDDEVVLLGVQNLSDPERYVYFETVTEWFGPVGRSGWSAKQFFGSGDSSVDQVFVMRVLVVDRRAHEAALGANQGKEGAWRATMPPAGATEEGSLRLVRQRGSGSCG